MLLCCLPLKHLRLTSGYGYRLHPISHDRRLHAGIDLAARSDTVYAVLDGRISRCAFDERLGLYIRIDHADGLQTVYGHLSQWQVLPGDTVRASDAVGVTGATGQVTGEHLHFAVQFHQHFIDPLRFLTQLFNRCIIN